MHCPRTSSHSRRRRAEHDRIGAERFQANKVLHRCGEPLDVDRVVRRRSLPRRRPPPRPPTRSGITLVHRAATIETAASATTPNSPGRVSAGRRGRDQCPRLRRLSCLNETKTPHCPLLRLACPDSDADPGRRIHRRSIDPYELKDLSTRAEYQGIKTELQRKMREWFDPRIAPYNAVQERRKS